MKIKDLQNHRSIKGRDRAVLLDLLGIDRHRGNYLFGTEKRPKGDDTPVQLSPEEWKNFALNANLSAFEVYELVVGQQAPTSPAGTKDAEIEKLQKELEECKRLRDDAIDTKNALLVALNFAQKTAQNLTENPHHHRKTPKTPIGSHHQEGNTTSGTDAHLTREHAVPMPDG